MTAFLLPLIGVQTQRPSIFIVELLYVIAGGFSVLACIVIFYPATPGVWWVYYLVVVNISSALLLVFSFAFLSMPTVLFQRVALRRLVWICVFLVGVIVVVLHAIALAFVLEYGINPCRAPCSWECPLSRVAASVTQCILSAFILALVLPGVVIVGLILFSPSWAEPFAEDLQDRHEATKLTPIRAGSSSSGAPSSPQLDAVAM